MARYDEAHKAQTRRRILDTAGRRLKRSGIDGSGVSALMSDAGLTNGAFYAHFGSKDQLVAVTVADQLTAQEETLRSLLSDDGSLQSFVEDYLSCDHRDHPDQGCPSAALLDEIARASTEIRSAYTEGIVRIIELVANRTGCDESSSARSTAIGVIAVLVGTMQLARAVTDEQLSAEILASGIAGAGRLLEHAEPNSH
ncbi:MULTISPECIES: TetR/AcrR family transcriptional regulator [Rhodococcus]|uniref:TetR/AcrR family transcriptional regulator n=1 Tax=Rhodococcus oxybenzonivorans TaxID=1990687 RepID=A0AAE4V6A2_9NOCA|nr:MULTISPECIES: TetR/AcrR family transcriptional regulator [Rhodococcus]MDV7242027.1 TetR/AcrR family transcriptional regulator [Rhodococcus oxybenzonivorans]MDV7269200.1 TetR/AcrR family transcriptional regulator [Rhodococcus oxybenzonivorans]MDV7278387.1 TetR/AcrR family transcriptional regulator [Rhodococcus oxybenzonivorans]MDV7337884.1 TetR/AcrR family transcriptional regulator [Rhodococcus oxybenzonivorans]MDV7343727.1 TetR/AcrR family transcriptional regulator [Rhodococcus oxybenzonivo